MAIATFTDFEAKLRQIEPMPIYKAAANARSFMSSAWIQVALAGTAPTTAAACNNTTTGALNLESEIGATGFNYMLTRASLNNAAAGIWMLIDRLSHQGGLSGTVTTAQTTNLPTAALTRYTSGEGVFGALEIYTSIGATATTATVSYTNQAGTAGRTSKEIVIGSTNYSSAGRMLPIPLADGDTGIRSVQSVTLLASTATAGNFGVTLYKPLCYIPSQWVGSEAHGTNIFNMVINGAAQACNVLEGACLSLINQSAAGGAGTFNLGFSEVS